MNKKTLVTCIFVFALGSCAKHYVAIPAATSFYEPGKPEWSINDPATELVITPWKHRVDSAMAQIICTTSVSLYKGVPESALGNLVADACFGVYLSKKNDIDSRSRLFCILNNGGLRSALPKGIITLRNIYELMPFDNELVVVRLPGKSVRTLFKYIIARGGVPVSNLRMSLADTLYQSIYVGANLFNDTLNYDILTSDYLAGGGDQMQMFGDSLHYENTGIKVRDAIILYLSEKGCDSAQTDGRISH